MTDAKPRGGHLYEVDVLRILTFVCVIAVHTISSSVEPGDRAMYVSLGLFHFTREVFFALTAFVLVYSFQRRPQPMRRFWPRRFLLVGVPYLVWSVLYQLYFDVVTPPASVGAAVGKLVVAVLTGTAAYHLYFLLVTMQVYLLLPVIVRLVRATRRHHVALLVAALAAQLVVLGLWAYVPGLAGRLGSIPNATFVSYTFMIIAGAVAADHLEPFLAQLRDGRRAIIAVAAATVLLAVGVFLLQMRIGMSDSAAVTALQPVIVVSATGIGLLFLTVGAAWSDRRVPGGRLDRAVAIASDVSFGVFLVHPLWIYLCTRFAAAPLQALADPWRQLVLYVVVVVASVLTAALLRRTPLSLPLTGRPRKRASERAPLPQTV
ncbi:acyltransferase [Amnibacterium kyonggiense]